MRIFMYKPPKYNKNLADIVHKKAETLLNFFKLPFYFFTFCDFSTNSMHIRLLLGDKN